LKKWILLLNKIEIFYLKVSLVNILTMSDIEEYFTDGSDDEDIESSDDEDDKIRIIKKTDENTIENILDNSDDEEDDDEDEDEEIKNKQQNDYYDEDEEQIGGASSDDESADDDEQSENEDITPLANKGKKTSKITIDPVLDEDEIEDYDDDDDDDENYLQKFDNEISKNYISEQHPECAIHNYDEIAKLTIIVKDNDGVIIDPLHKTLPFLTKYEKTRVLGQRTKQIECGATPFIKVPEGIIDAHIIAELELQQKRIPVIIRRPLPGGSSEYWNLKDLEMILF
jgi:DNA-directed RNA polymerase I, II, and III subunit RPABC2